MPIIAPPGIGSLLFAIGLVSTATLSGNPSIPDVAIRLAVCGIGFGLFQAPNNRVLITSAPRIRSGAASGMMSMARLLGQSLGAAVAAIVFGLTASFNLPLTMGLAAAFALASAIMSIWR